MPDIPTVAESGLPDFEVTAWFGIFAPAQTPQPVVARLNTELVKILAMADVREKLANHGVEPGGGSPESLGRFLVSEVAKWGDVVREAGIRTE